MKTQNGLIRKEFLQLDLIHMTKVVSIDLAYNLECSWCLCLLHVLTAPLQNILNVHLLALSEDDNSGQLLFSLEK